MTAPAYKRILLKLSGEALMGSEEVEVSGVMTPCWSTLALASKATRVPPSNAVTMSSSGRSSSTSGAGS